MDRKPLEQCALAKCSILNGTTGLQLGRSIHDSARMEISRNQVASSSDRSFIKVRNAALLAVVIRIRRRIAIVSVGFRTSRLLHRHRHSHRHGHGHGHDRLSSRLQDVGRRCDVVHLRSWHQHVRGRCCGGVGLDDGETSSCWYCIVLLLHEHLLALACGYQYANVAC